MSTFGTDETSVSGSRPVDLYVIVTPTVTYRLTSYAMDVVYSGNTYTATTMSRGPHQIAQDLTGRELVVYLPISHALVQRYCSSAIPEHSIVLTASRLQQTSGVATQFHVGFSGGISIDGHVAALRFPSVTDDAMRVSLPVIALQKTCNHVLYDAQCTKSRAASSTTTTITAISGSVVTVAAVLVGTGILYGDMIHGPTLQPRMVIAQTGSALTLSDPIVGAVVGDSVTIALGCAHDVTTCRDTFANVINFGGHPDVNPEINYWSYKGLGVVTQI